MNQFFDVQDVASLLRVSREKAYQVIRELNKELSEKGFITVRGRVSSRYLYDRLNLEAESKTKAQ